MHLVTLGERECAPHEPGKSWAQDAVESFDVTGPVLAFARGPVLPLWQHLGIGGPEVRVTQPAFVVLWDALPK